jgi:hypothetical protein
MSDEPESPTGQGANEATLARHLLELRQTLDRLSKEDSRLELQQIQLQSQAAKYEDFTETAQTADKENLLRYAQERLRELQPQLTKVLEQRAQLKAQIDASDPDVLAVGGTKLNTNFQTGDYTSEVVWNDDIGASGGGLSTIFSEPDYQKKLPNQNALQGKRGIPDVAFPADNFLVYDPTITKPFFQGKPEWAHWAVVGGTSASAPCWAGFIAIANQIRGKPLGLVQPALYSLNGKDMHDILSGDNSYANVQGYRAAKGFDLATGWGTPIASAFLPALVKAADQLGQNNT